MSENHFDEYEHFNYDQEKYMNAGHSGKQRSKKEAAEHTNKNDPSGHSRKIVTKMINTENNRKKSNSTSSNGSSSGKANDESNKDES
jgi:nuclear protein 1